MNPVNMRFSPTSVLRFEYSHVNIYSNAYRISASWEAESRSPESEVIENQVVLHSVEFHG
jgi:hypothetical protein